LVHDRFLREYAATRARRAISLKAIRHSDDDLWSFVMLPDAPPVSRHPPFSSFLCNVPPRPDTSLFPAEGDRERRAVRPTHAPSPSARAWRSGGSRSERRVRRSEGFGGGHRGH
jgi:hypothetical protein